jgi:hypothetical protein
MNDSGIVIDGSNNTPGTWACTDCVPAETPLPAGLPLFASGLGVLGLLGWRGKRKSRAADEGVGFCQTRKGC